MIRTDLFERGVPWVRLILAGRGSAQALNAGPRHRASAALVVLAVGSTALRRPLPAGAATLAFLIANRDFHALLRRRLGRRGALWGPPLHALHLAAAMLAIPVGVVSHLRQPTRRAATAASTS
jgi:hypothetical protein